MISSASIKMVISEIQWFLKEYYFEEFIKLLYYFTWSKVCAWYELIKFVLCRDNEEEKTVLTQKILLILFRNLLR
jgi:valyl-tRNA synthetase